MTGLHSIRTHGLVISILALAFGCSQSEKPLELRPLKGTIMQNGKALTRGGLIFVPEPALTSNLVVNATAESDGTFVAKTLQSRADGSIAVAEGAPIGKYKVIYHPPSNGSKSGLEIELNQLVTVENEAKPVSLVVPTELPQGNGMPRDDDPTVSKTERETEKR